MHNKLNIIKLLMSGEAETGNAGEQPVRNSLTDWNGQEVGNDQPPYYIIPVIYASKNSNIFFMICMFHAEAVHSFHLRLP